MSERHPGTGAPRGVERRAVLKVPAGAGDDAVAMEEPLELRVQGEVLAVTMRTPGRDEWLALGFLLSEGLIRSAADVGALAHCGRPGDEGFGNALEVTPAPGYRFPFDRLESSRRGTIASACGVCGRQRVDDLMARVVKVPAGAPVPLPVVQRGPEVLRHTQAIFEQTGGTHAAALLDVGGEVLVAAEDVGRHNAVDKVVGGALQKGLLSRAAVLMVSGRASFEMVQKAAMARVGVLASVSAPTTLAVDLAERAGLALVAFVRGSSAAIYGTRDRLALHAGQPREGG